MREYQLDQVIKKCLVLSPCDVLCASCLESCTQAVLLSERPPTPTVTPQNYPLPIQPLIISPLDLSAPPI